MGTISFHHRTARFNGVVLCRQGHNLNHSEYGRYATEGDFRSLC